MARMGKLRGVYTLLSQQIGYQFNCSDFSSCEVISGFCFYYHAHIRELEEEVKLLIFCGEQINFDYISDSFF